MRKWLLSRRIWGSVGVVLVVLASGLWWQRLALLRWYCIRGLIAASPENRHIWIERVVSLDSEVVPDLLDCLTSATPPACAGAAACLEALARNWGSGDTRTVKLGERLVTRFDSFSLPGREAALEWWVAVLSQERHPSPRAVQSATQLLNHTLQQPASGIHLRALALANVLVEQQPTGPTLTPCRQLLQQGLKADDVERRVAAIHLALHPVFREEIDLLKQVLPLLRDQEARVRRAAILAVGPVRTLITEEDLLPLLHDSDAEVRRLCESALRSRGLNDTHVLLGRLVSDPRPTARLQVLPELREASDLDPGVWLRRLSHDPAPAVRAAALRETRFYPGVDLRDRLQEMAQSDPSPTVRQLASYYLQQR